MKPVEFPEANATFAKDQPEYVPLPAFVHGGEVISCWSLTWRERLRVLFGGRLWLRQLTFGAKLQPQLPQVEYPFVATMPRRESDELPPVLPGGAR